jgi:thymidylate kinase
VALLGPDGAGKSTLANGIEQSFVFPVRQVYMGLTGGMLRHVDRLRIPGVVRVGRLLVIWARYFRAQYHMARGRLVVFDRYIYDAEVPTPHPLGPADRLGRWIDGRACPAPDLILVLDAPGAVMHQRKGEYDPVMLEEWRQRFRSLQRRLPRVELIDTTRDIGAVRAEVVGRLWHCYAVRWRKR